MKRVVVAGATGYLGRHIVKELKSRGYYVRALARSKGKLIDLADSIDDIYEGEVTRPETLTGLCTGMDAVISTLGITRQKDGLTYQDVDYKGNLAILNLARISGARKFVYVSVMNAEKMKQLEIIKAKEAFVEKLRSSKMDYCVIRPTGFYSDMLEFLTMAGKGRVSLFGSGENRMNPIHGADLAEVCADALETKQREINVGGPEVFSYAEIGELAFETLNKKPKLSRMPVGMVKLFLGLLRFFTGSKTYGPVEFFATVMTMDTIGERYGTRRLADTFAESVTQSGRAASPVGG